MSSASERANLFFALLFVGYALSSEFPMAFYLVEALTGLLLLGRILRERSLEINQISFYTLLFLAYLPANFIAMLRLEHTVVDFLTVAVQFLLIATVVVYVSQLRGIKPNVLLRLWVLIGLAVAGVTFAEYAGILFFGFETPFYSGSLPRATGPFGEPSNIGHFLMPPFAIALVSSLRKDYLLSSRYRQYAALFAITLAVILSLSQGAFVVLVALFGLALVGPVTDFLTTLRVSAAAVGGLLVTMAVPQGRVLVKSYFFRMVETVTFLLGVSSPRIIGFNSSIQTRIGDGVLNLLIWLDHPIFGVGANQIRHHYMNYKLPIGTSPQPIYGIPLTGYLADFGIVGFAIIAAINLACFRVVLVAWQQESNTLWPPALFLVLVSRVFTQLLTGGLVNPGIWVAIAVVIGCRYGQEDKNRSERAQDIAVPNKEVGSKGQPPVSCKTTKDTDPLDPR